MEEYLHDLLAGETVTIFTFAYTLHLPEIRAAPAPCPHLGPLHSGLPKNLGGKAPLRICLTEGFFFIENVAIFWHLVNYD